MTVAELIEKLGEYGDHLEVRVVMIDPDDGEESFYTFDVETTTIYLKGQPYDGVAIVPAM